jgi:hypothetical protein
MKFEFVVKISPPGVFGVPDEGRTVVPSTPARQVTGPAIHVRTMRVFGHGTLSEYRREGDALRLTLDAGPVHLRTHDNYFVFTTEAEDMRAAFALVRPVIERLMRLLTMEYGIRFEHEGEYVDTEDERTLPWPEGTEVTMFHATMYSLKDLADRVQAGFAGTAIVDKRLDRALAYFESAVLLRDAFVSAAFATTRASMLQALSFLQLWKAIATVLGEPGADSDYQSRFRDIGLPAGYWQHRVQPLYKVRNDEDVAHYTLDDGPSPVLVTSFGQAFAVCQEVLRAYCQHLQNRASH